MAEIPLKSTLVYNDARETLLAKYLDDQYEEKYFASGDDGVTSAYINSLRSLVEIFIREHQGKYNGKLTLHKLIKYPSYSDNWEDLIKAIMAIQNRRLNLAIEYDPEKMVHFARVYDMIGKDKNPMKALFNAVLSWIYKNTTTMGMFKDVSADDIAEMVDL